MPFWRRASQQELDAKTALAAAKANLRTARTEVRTAKVSVRTAKARDRLQRTDERLQRVVAASAQREAAEERRFVGAELDGARRGGRSPRPVRVRGSWRARSYRRRRARR